jgi:hypothetical protein
MIWRTLLYLSASLPVLAALWWFVFRPFLSRDARYLRRLKRRHELQLASDRARQQRMLESRMREVHEQGLRWEEVGAHAETPDREWRQTDRE